MKVYFLDTNIFLQCRDLKDLPWHEIADNQDLTLLIPRTVQEEIDRQKSDGNTRRGKRARNASSFFREIIFSTDTSIILRESNPRVVVTFPDIKSSSVAPASDFLDLSRPDDSIIHELCLYQRENPTFQIQLLTHDTNPMLTCKKIGVAFQDVPDTWLLTPEPDTKDKRINELEKKLKSLECSLPRIEFRILEAGAGLTSACFGISTYTPLSETEVQALVSETCRRLPMKVDFDEPESNRRSAPPFANSFIDKHMMGFEWVYKKPTDDEIDEYKSVIYPKWVENLTSFYEKLPFALGLSGYHFEIEIELTNNGSLPAEHLVLEIEAVGGLLLTKLESKEQLVGKAVSVPPPEPEQPKGQWIQHKIGFNLLGLDPYSSALRVPDHMLNPIRNLRQRDKHSFYRKDDNSGVYTKVWIFECDEYRHKVKPKVFKLFVFVPPKQPIRKGAISVTVTAKNLPEPCKMILPVTVNYTSVGTLEIAQNLLPVTFPGIKDILSR